MALKWKPISRAPKSDIPVALLRVNESLDYEDKLLINYTRVQHSKNNIYYAPIHYGDTCVRDATHFMLMKDLAPMKVKK